MIEPAGMPSRLTVDTVEETIAGASLIKQVECPSVANPPYNTQLSITPGGVSIGNSSLKYVGEKAIPHALGYLNYNFTALGSNDGTFDEKTGFDGTYATSKRVLGYNYFTKTGAICNSSSEADCVGKDQYTYIRNYPVFTKKYQAKGNLSFAFFNDVIDLNPVPLLKSLITPGVSEKCKMSPLLSVGSAIDSPKQFADKTEFVTQYNACIPGCPSKPSVAERENCLKDCLRGHWKDRKCIPVIAPEPQLETFHTNSGQIVTARTPSRWTAWLAVAVVVMVIVTVSLHRNGGFHAAYYSS